MFGLRDLHAADVTHSTLVWGLLGNTVVFIFTVYQLKTMWPRAKAPHPVIRDEHTSTDDASTDLDIPDSIDEVRVEFSNPMNVLQKLPILYQFVRFIERCLIINSTLICTFVALGVAVSVLSPAHFVLLLFLLATLVMASGISNLGLLTLLYSWV